MKQSGGLAEIVAAVILVGVVLAVLISAVIPLAINTRDANQQADNRTTSLDPKLNNL